MVLAVNAAVAWEPLVASEPDHAPEAVQDVAFVVLQVRVDVPPEATLVGLAVKVTAGAGLTVTVTELEAVPPAPVQASV